MNRIPTPRRRNRPDFSLTIVNVVFLLLIFYLASGTLVARQEIEAAAPFTRDLPLEMLPRPLLLVGGDGSLVLDGVPVETAALEAAIERVSDEGVLNVLPDRAMPARALLPVLARIEGIGVEARIVTLHARSEPSALP